MCELIFVGNVSENFKNLGTGMCFFRDILFAPNTTQGIVNVHTL